MKYEIIHNKQPEESFFSEQLLYHLTNHLSQRPLLDCHFESFKSWLFIKLKQSRLTWKKVLFLVLFI